MIEQLLSMLLPSSDGRRSGSNSSEATKVVIDLAVEVRSLVARHKDLQAELTRLRAENEALRERVRLLEAAEEGAKEAFGVVVQAKHDALAECERLRKLLDGAHSQIRRMARESEAASCGVNR